MQRGEPLGAATAASTLEHDPCHPQLCCSLLLSWTLWTLCCRYNDSIPAEIGARIPACGAAGQQALAVLVANSRAIWEPFLSACATENLLQQENPLECYLQQHLSSSLATCAQG